MNREIPMIARLLGGAATLALTAGAASADYTLHVLHVNDLHSRIEAINGSDSTCSAEDAAENACFGGVARLYTKVNELRDAIRAEGGNVIVLDAGDQFQGSLMYTTYKGTAEAEFMNAIGFDAMAVGNHEFDDGPEKLAEFVDLIEFPIISGNLDLSQSNVLKEKVQNHVVLEVGGERIGLISALATDTVETSSPGPNVIFQDEIDSLGADVQTLTDEGVTKIIALTHVGLPKDIDIAAAVPGIDAVVGGHSHTYLSASDPARAGAYPTWVTQEDGTFVPIVQAYAYSKYLGHLVLTFDDAGKLIDASGDTILLDAAVPEDETILARVAELAGPIEELKNRVVASTAEAIEGSREVCRQVECPMGNLVADAMLDRVKDQGVTIAIQNGGGLRASIDAGDVTMGEVLTVLPFQNTLATFQVTGEQIVAALENGVSQVADGAGRFPQVAGLKYTFDPAKEPGARVSDVLVAEGDAFVPIDPAKVYGVVTNNYVRTGGDGFRMFVDAQNAYDFGPPLENVVADFMAAQGAAYTPYTDGRITRIE
jgi:5'-nucleotidase